jgi:hypothetical protein
MKYNHPQDDENLQLPALISRAQQYLAEAKTSAELLQARAAAQAALHYARLRDAAIEVQADCLRIIKFAELRLADELDAAQERGEVATDATGGGRPPKTCPSNGQVSKPATFGDLSIDRRRVHEWRQLREAGGEALVEKTIQSALSEGRAPKASDIQSAVRKITVKTRWMTIPARIITTTIVPHDHEKEHQKRLWWSVRHGIFSELNTQPNPVEAAMAVPADERAWTAQRAMRHSRWIAKFADTLLEEASKTLPPAEEDARPQ